MKILLFSVFSFFTIAMLPQGEEKVDLKVEVNSLHNNKGTVIFLLYNKDGSIPDEELKHYYKIVKEKITNKSSAVTFAQIPKGKYAVKIIQDENMNGKIDKGFFLPVEGIGFSNYQSIGLTNIPSFKRASFDLNENKTILVKIIYM